jgi:AraC-like DNA-binding protein
VDAGFQLERLAFGPDATTCQGLSLLLAERGELRCYLASREPGRLAEGDVLVLGPRASARLSARRSGALGILFRAQGEWLARALALAGVELASASLRAATLRAGTHAARRAALCLRALAALASEPLPETPLRQAVRALELLGIAVAAGSQVQDEAPRQRRSVARLAVAEALEALAREPGDGLTLSRLAARLGLSERQTSRLVRERLGGSLGDHVTELRVARAKRLLLETDLAVIDVAAEAGFGSLGHFNQVFRSRSGSTPSAFRTAARRRALPIFAPPAQPTEPAGGALACGSADGLDARASLRSSCFTIDSTQAERGTLPS